ncbi:MAG: hypothetical protein NTX53_03605 [candidate division WOR-3 bacterium]|nr:hypothetical protein [candidate division WOR-3 bacterium]
MYRVTKVLMSVTAIFLSLVLDGCATFRGNEIPLVTDYPQQSVAPDKRGSLFLSATYRWNDPRIEQDREEGGPNVLEEMKHGPFEHWTRLAAESSGLFTRVTTEEDQKPEAAYRLRVGMSQYENQGCYYCAIGVFSISLMVLPVCFQTYYNLSATFEDSTGLHKEYRYRDHVNRWIGLLALPLVFFAKEDPTESVKNNMLRRLFSDIARDEFGIGH